MNTNVAKVDGHHIAQSLRNAKTKKDIKDIMRAAYEIHKEGKCSDKVMRRWKRLEEKRFNQIDEALTIADKDYQAAKEEAGLNAVKDNKVGKEIKKQINGKKTTKRTTKSKARSK